MEVHEPAVNYQKAKYTAEAFLEMERNAADKHEFYRGEVFAMARAGIRHNIIFKNTYGNLYSALKGKTCQPYGSDLRVHIPENTLFTYPDISVFCGDLLFSVSDTETAVKPTIIFEILSPATKNYDRGEKFMLYRAIETLKEYVLIDSDSVHLEHFSINNEGLWQLKEYNTLDTLLPLATISISLLLGDIYDSITY